MTLGDKIRHLRENRNMTQTDVAKRVGIATQTIFKYEKGMVTNIPLENIEKLADIFEVSPSYLMGWEEKDETTFNIEDRLLPPTITEDTVTFPILGEIAAGYDMIAVEDWSGETIEIPRYYLKGRPMEDYFVLRVHGDSMYPQYQDGDIVLILKQTTLNRSGEIGAVIYEDDTATLKKVEYVPGEDWMEMIPLNPEFKPKRIEGEALEHCRILGIPKLLIREI
ncbi:MAG: helix-turn-helix domain-containing protein [Clostridia bacterium]|nr:helix-turn-helix domain-containing protein [Clostridia bacterium]